MAVDPFFHRRELAQAFADRILSPAVLAPARSGLFLAAPRRTGKSTFLREDLIPVLEAAGAAVLYIDLWADKTVDPGQAIVSMVRAALGGADGLVLKAFRKAGLDKVAVAGLSFDVAKIGLGTGVTLSAALAALSDQLKRMIVLIIDEAQHAVTTTSGNDALFALKAARDELNSSEHHGLRIVATGSSQAKLALLRASKDQAFYKAMMQAFPPLERTFIEWFVRNTGLAVHLDVDKAFELFAKTGYRPEVLIEALGNLQDGRRLTQDNVDSEFAQTVHKAIEDSDEAMVKVVSSLTPLQGAVLRVMIQQGETYAPYAASTLEAYRKEIKRAAAEANVDVPNVQTALEALQNKALVWRAAHGEYALEEQGVADLLVARGLL
ncbi:MAG: ATP-binding protein [Burkholderiales bacterium]|jgi:hypothetical protein|nr:ATP-binding protein [Burkholderiales bacterium]